MGQKPSEIFQEMPTIIRHIKIKKISIKIKTRANLNFIAILLKQKIYETYFRFSNTATSNSEKTMQTVCQKKILIRK